jgi:hypothetical protein
MLVRHKRTHGDASAAQIEHITPRQDRALDRDSIEQRSIAGVQILDSNLTIRLVDSRVQATDTLTGNHDFCGFRATKKRWEKRKVNALDGLIPFNDKRDQRRPPAAVVLSTSQTSNP